MLLCGLGAGIRPRDLASCGHCGGAVSAIVLAENKEQALETIARLQNGRTLGGMQAYPVNRSKAIRIFNGENPLDALGV